jgi:hypothetical protein
VKCQERFFFSTLNHVFLEIKMIILFIHFVYMFEMSCKV